MTNWKVFVSKLPRSSTTIESGGKYYMKEIIRQALERGFTRETRAYRKYALFAQAAEEEVKNSSEKEKVLLLEAAKLFRRIAEEEAGHAEYYLTVLGEIGDTNQNLHKSIEAEENDIVEYTISASAARTDEMEDIARAFERIAKSEKHHVELFSKLSERMQDLWFDDRLNQITPQGNKPD
jgi:rubrerythrin